MAVCQIRNVAECILPFNYNNYNNYNNLKAFLFLMFRFVLLMLFTSG